MQLFEACRIVGSVSEGSVMNLLMSLKMLYVYYYAWILKIGFNTKVEKEGCTMFQIEKVRNKYTELLNEWQWELHATINFGRKVQFGTATQYAKQWLHLIRREYKNLRFAAVLFVSNPHDDVPHVHILLISDPRYAMRLSDVPMKRLEKLCKEDCKITSYREWSNDKISAYVSKEKNLHLYNPDKGGIDFFRPNLLKKLRSRRTNQSMYHYQNKSLTSMAFL